MPLQVPNAVFGGKPVRIPIRVKLAGALAVPLIALIAMATVEVLRAQERAQDVRDESALATAAVGPGSLISTLQDERNFSGVNLLGLKCSSPMKIAHVSKERLRDAILEVNRGKVDAVVQVGTNLAMAEVAATAEFWPGKPVIAINTATYWYALRRNGIKDRQPGWGSLFLQH